MSRSVRFAVRLSSEGARLPSTDAMRHNSFAALPSMVGLGLHCEMTVSVRGQPDAQTGYLMNISAIDSAVRSKVISLIERRVGERATASAETLLHEALQVLQSTLGGVLDRVRWNLSPYYSITMTAAAPDRVLMTQSFEFAAAHRLHCADLDERANREIFGKCNNPSGHGHNYRLEVTVDKPLDGGDAQRLTLPAIERIVDERVIRRFDHKHLNLDTTEFTTLNPSVENIARVCHDLLAEPIRNAGGRLRRVTVWETEKTSCTYPAGE